MARKTIKNRVIVKDGGFGAFVRNTRSLQGRVLVGLEDKPRKDGVSMAEVALANEYGTDVIPARPFVRPAFDHNLEALSKLKAELATAVQSGTMKAETALRRVGAFMRDKVRREILDKETPPNAPSTIARKGFDDPLVETGEMVHAVTYAVQLDGKKGGST